MYILQNNSVQPTKRERELERMMNGYRDLLKPYMEKEKRRIDIQKKKTTKKRSSSS